MHIKIDHIAKVEGHIGFTADIVNGQVKKARIDILEGARLLEGILRDRSIFEVSQISARICGVCPVVHSLTSLKALEKALDIEVSEKTILLRKLMMMGQIINSHALHLFFFSLSDFFGIKNDLDLIKKYPERANDALVLRGFGNKIIEIIGGRSIHPLTPTIGGFLKMPDQKKLAAIFEQCDAAQTSAQNLTNLFLSLKHPEFTRAASYVSLSDPKEYALYGDPVKISGDKEESPANFLKIVQEYQLQNSVTKHSYYQGKPFMVGALSRINNNSKQLNPAAKKSLKSTKNTWPSFNPFYNILAQSIELIHCVEEAKKLLHQALLKDLTKNDLAEKETLIAARIKSMKDTASGTAAIEAPRGTLYYFYEIDKRGKIKNCNIITPTAQNMARLERDVEEYLPKIVGKKNPTKETEEKIKMLIRAYDPCITCATH